MLKLQKIFLTVLALYLVIGMHIVLPTPGGAGLYLAPNIIGWCFISLLITIGGVCAYKKRFILVHDTFKYLVVGFLFLLIPFTVNNDLSYLAIPRILAILGILVLFFALFQCDFNCKLRKKIIVILLLGVVIEVTLGLVQFYLLLLFNIDILGYTPLFGKPYGSFTQNNVMASFLATGVALSLFIQAKNLSHKSVLIKMLTGYTLFGTAVLLVLLQSKTGVLATLIVILLFIPPLKEDKSSLKFSSVAVLFGIIIGVLSQIQLKLPVKDNIASDQGVRSTIYAVSFDMFKDQPLTGYGYGNFERAYREYHLHAMQGNPELDPPLEDLGHPHNELLYWGVEGGISALFGLALFLVAIVKLVSRHTEIIKNRMMYFALIAPLLLHSQLEYPFSHSIVHLVYLIILLWFISDVSEKTDGINKYTVTTKVLPFSAAMISILVIPFMLSTLHTSYLMEEFKKSNYQSTKFITEIINPIAWQQYYELVIYTQGLRNGYKNQDANALKRYIDWGTEYVSHTPRRGIYQNMLNAIETLTKVGESISEDKKMRIADDYQRLYPSNVSLKQNIKKAP